MTENPISAFPHKHDVYDNKGMTLRDYFAAEASEEDIKHFRPKGFNEEYVIDLGHGRKEIAIRPAMWTREQARYIYADAMLEARK